MSSSGASLPSVDADISRTVGAHEIHVYSLQGEDYTEMQVRRFWKVLGDIERQQAQSYAVENRRRDFICLHALAHVLLAQALQVDDEELKFERVQGKLACESARSAGLAFSLSYTRGRAVCAVGRASRLGVDIERVQPLVDFDCLAESVLSEAELRFIRAPALQSESVDNFYALWTLKEAYLKALEVGLTVPLRDISFDLASCQGGRPSSDTPLLKGDSFLCVSFQERDFIGSLVYEHNQRWPLKILHFGPSYVARLLGEHWKG